MDENTNIPSTQLKKKRITKVVFYVMSILLLSTTAMCAFMTYKLIKSPSTCPKSCTSSSDATDTTEPATDVMSGNTIPEGYTLISDDDLEKLKDDSYYLGRDNILSSIKPMMENGSTTLKMLRSIYPDHLIYADAGSYIFIDINTDLVMNDYVKSGFKIE